MIRGESRDMLNSLEEIWVDEYLVGSINVISKLKEKKSDFQLITDLIYKSLNLGGTIYWMGNGGSASDAMHLSCELSSKFEHERKKLRSIPLTGNVSHITATANDYDYKKIFSSQIEAYGKESDVLIGLSTSGKSLNILEAFKSAKLLNIKTVLLTGANYTTGSSDIVLSVDSERTGNIQEALLVAGQIICGLVESRFK